jgi:isopropylmalate/homocitrate/citramalate synthase
VGVEAVLRVTERLVGLGIDAVSISDTIGVGTPNQVVELVEALGDVTERERLALHFHDTRGTALANVLAGLQMGIAVFDASAGGLGGCPYAPGASGNLATEDLLYLLHGLGIETGVSLDAVVAASQFLADATGRSPASRYFHAATA